MYHYQSILVGADFSPHSACAIQHGVHLAREHDAELRILHLVHHEAAAVECRREHAGITEIVRARRVHLERFVEEVVPDQDGLKLRLDTYLGHRFSSLMEAAEEYRVDLLILGSRGKDAAADRGVTGSLAVACVRKAPCQVLLVTADCPPPFRHIVIGVDFSDCSRLAVLEAAKLTQNGPAKLSVVHLYVPPWSRLAYGDRRSGVTAVQSEELKAAVALELEQFVDQLGESLAGRRVMRELVESTDPIGGLMEYLKEHQADLVAVGVRGQNRQQLAVLGSFAERVLLSAGTAVLAVQPEGKA